VGVHRRDAARDEELEQRLECSGVRLTVAEAPGGVTAYDQLRVCQEVDETVVRMVVGNPDQRLDRHNRGDWSGVRQPAERVREALLVVRPPHLSCELGRSPQQAGEVATIDQLPEFVGDRM
jgi:hypothetical protein